MAKKFIQTLGPDEPGAGFAYQPPQQWAQPQQQAPQMMPQGDDEPDYIKTIRARMAQPLTPEYTPEEVQQRRAENDRQSQLGLLMQLSGDETFAPIGGQMLKQALAGREKKISERGSTDPITGEFKYDPDYLRQRDEGSLAQYEQGRISARDKKELALKEMDGKRELRLLMGANSAGRAKDAQDSHVWRGEDALRADYDRLTKDLREEVNATGKIATIANANLGRKPDAITQQSLVILLNKFLDPGSVVREGEFDRVVKAQGLEGRAANLRDYILKGQPLDANTIAQINGLAKLYSQAAEGKLRRHGAEYTAIAQRRGFDPQNVISDARWRGGGEEPAPSVDVGAMFQSAPAAPAGNVRTPQGAPRQALPLSNPQPQQQNRIVQAGF